MGMQVFDNVSGGKGTQLMSRQLHRSVIKEQLAPFWVDMCHLLSQCRLPWSLHFLCFQRGTANEGSPSFSIPTIGLLRKKTRSKIHLQQWNVRVLESQVTIDVKLVYPHAALIFTQFNNRTSVCCHYE